jgi:hypothetical protein
MTLTSEGHNEQAIQKLISQISKVTPDPDGLRGLLGTGSD